MRTGVRTILQCAAVALALAVAGGCAVGPNYETPRIATAKKFGEIRASSGSTNAVPSVIVDSQSPVIAWWHTFRDPDLDRLVEAAVRENLDLQIASERIVQARAQRRVVASGLFPEIETDGGYNRARGSKNVVLPLGPGGSGGGAGSAAGAASPSGQPAPKVASAAKADPPGDPPAATGAGTLGGGGLGANPSANILSPFGKGGLPGVTTDLYQLGFDSTWELDVFGGVRRNLEAARADLEAAVESRRDILVTLLAEVARNYLDLRGTQQRLAVANENLAAQKEILELTQSMRNSGLVSELDVARAAGQVATTAAGLPPLHSQTRQAIHALSTLLALDPTRLSAELEEPKPLPTMPPAVPVGLPSELLLRRPDIRRAERQLHAATARVGAAKADLFPKFALTGSAGLDSSSIGHLFDWQSHYFLISPTVDWPVFDAGRIRANVRLREAARRESLLQYRTTVLAAFREVDDELVAYTTEQTRRAALKEAVNQDRRALEIAQDQYRHGLADFLTVLDAQRAVLAAQDSLTQSDQTVATDLVALYKALGGGWQANER